MFRHLRGHKVAVALSGGVDSLCSLLLLKDAGIDVCAVHGLFLDKTDNEQTIQSIRAVCQKLKIELFIADLRKQFTESIIQPFCRAYKTAQTPNPCAWCNKKIKFGHLWQHASEMGATKLATGHYAKVEKNPYQQNGGPILGRAQDTQKDQAYFLALLDREQLERTVLPMAYFSKTQCRQMTAAAGLTVPVPRESQDICFIQNDYRNLLAGESKPGPIILAGAGNHAQVIGQHAGLGHYTIGQRKGLGIPWSEPLYVVGKNIDANTLVVGPKPWLGQSLVHVRPVSVHVDARFWPARIFVRLRYRGPLLACSASFTPAGMAITLKDRMFVAAPGQIAAIYDEASRILMGGVITD